MDREKKTNIGSSSSSSSTAMLNVTYFGNCVCHYIQKPQLLRTQLVAAVSSERITATLCLHVLLLYGSAITAHHSPNRSIQIFYFIYFHSFLGFFVVVVCFFLSLLSSIVACVFIFAFSSHQFTVCFVNCVSKKKAKRRKRKVSRCAGSGQK